MKRRGGFGGLRGAGAALAAAGVLLSGWPAAGDGGPRPGIEVVVEVADGTAHTVLRRVLENNKADEAWFEVHANYPASAWLERLAVERAGRVVEEAEVSAGASPNGTPSAGEWLAALPSPADLPPVGASQLSVAVRVPAGESATLIVGWAEGLRAVRGAYRYRLPLDGLGPSQDFGFAAHLTAAAPIGQLAFGGPVAATSSGLGSREVNVSAPRAALSAAPGWLTLNFTLEATPGHGLVSSCLDEGGGFFTYTFFPGSLDLALEPLPKSISYAIDFSGSMAGDKERQAKAAFAGILGQLDPADRFEVLRFDSKVVPLTVGLEQALPDNISRAIDRINGQVVGGSTNLGAAIERALSDLSAAAGALPMLVLMTDGNPTVGLKTEEELLRLAHEKNVAGAAIHTLALGFEASVEILEALSAQSGGTSTVIDPNADVVQQIADFYGEVSQPLIENLTMTFFEPAFNVSVPPLSVLYGGSDITARGRLRPFAGAVGVLIEGRTSRGQFSLSDSFMPERSPCGERSRDLALQALEGLVHRASAEGESPPLVGEIVNISAANHFATPWTPFRLRSGAALTTEPLPEPMAPQAAPPSSARFEAPGLSEPLLLAVAVAAAAGGTLLILWSRSRGPREGGEA